jgi:hypothetical protein
MALAAQPSNQLEHQVECMSYTEAFVLLLEVIELCCLDANL